MDAEIMRFCRALMRDMGNMSIRNSQYAVLNIMCRTSGPHMPVGLAETLGVSKAMVSAHLAALMERGLVVRVPSPEDGRSVYVMPSKRGKDLFNKIARANNEKLNLIKTQLGAKKFDTFIKLISQVNQIID